MISGSKIIGFIPIRDAECALDFYQNLLGLHFLNDDSFAIVLESNGIMIRLVRTEGFTPALYTILGWQVENIEEVVKELAAIADGPRAEAAHVVGGWRRRRAGR